MFANEGWNELVKKENKRDLVKFESFASHASFIVWKFIISVRTYKKILNRCTHYRGDNSVTIQALTL